MQYTTLIEQKNKNYIIMSIDIVKVFDRIQHPFTVKMLKTVGMNIKGLPQSRKGHLRIRQLISYILVEN